MDELPDVNVHNNSNCKYCEESISICNSDSLQCTNCGEFVHLKCLKRGAVPGGLVGDVFYDFVCLECSSNGAETFIRGKMPWLQAILLSLFHMQSRSPGLARKGYFHWKVHIAAFIDRNWDTIFRKDFKRKKKWTGTISGTLSHFSPQFFKSGTSIFNEQGWWTLTYPTLSPNIIVQLNAQLTNEKHRLKELKISTDDLQLLKKIILSKPYANEDITRITMSYLEPLADYRCDFTPNPNQTNKRLLEDDDKVEESAKEKKVVDSFQPIKKLMKYHVFKSKPPPSKIKLLKLNMNNLNTEDIIVKQEQEEQPLLQETTSKSMIDKLPKHMDFLHFYNTTYRGEFMKEKLSLNTRLLGGAREEPVLSPFTLMYLKPYIKRFSTINAPWLQLMDDIKRKVNANNMNWKLPPRSSIDLVYVQPEHIAAINSLCNEFFWTGIDLSDALRYPDFSCVALYRKLIIGFAFLVPNINVNENYLSFMFIRPGWRNCGIATFMLYHLIQTSVGSDITLHVSLNNPALFLYQKFGFKVEYVVLNFYHLYMPDDARESKHAFFCRLER